MSERDEREMPPEIRAAARKLSPQTRGLVRAMAEAMAAHVRTLHSRVEELERRPTLRDAGVWSAEKTPYGLDAIVTDRGSAWIAKRATCQRPGEDNDDWRLMVKRGRDGRDAKGAARPIGRIDQ